MSGCSMTSMSRRVVPPKFDFVQKPRCADGKILHGGDYCAKSPDGYIYKVEGFCEDGSVIAYCPTMGYVKICPECMSHVDVIKAEHLTQSRLSALIASITRALDLR